MISRGVNKEGEAEQRGERGETCGRIDFLRSRKPEMAHSVASFTDCHRARSSSRKGWREVRQVGEGADEHEQSEGEGAHFRCSAEDTLLVLFVLHSSCSLSVLLQWAPTETSG